MKKIYLLFSLLVFTLGCQKDEMETDLVAEEVPEVAHFKNIRFKNLPLIIKQYFENEILIKSSNNLSSDVFGSVNKKIPAKKVISEKGLVTYTLVLNQADKIGYKNYFDNLVIFATHKNKTQAYILRYKPDKEWYENSQDFEYYSGEIIVYTLDGKIVDNLNLDKGELLKQTTKSSSCDLVFVKEGTVCTNGGTLEGYENTIGWECQTSYEMRFECNIGGGSGPDGTDPGTGDTGGSTDGSGSSSGSDTYDFTPTEGNTIPTLPKEEKDPCKEMSELAGNSSFVGRMKDLKSKTGLNYESGYLLKIEDNM